MLASLFKLDRQLLALAVAVTASATYSVAEAKGQCSATPISLSEATHLLNRSPALLEVRREGQVPTPRAWEPDGPYHHNSTFFYFDVRAESSDSADGGLIGYFAVSKASARVFNISVNSELLSGATLDAATRAIRTRHCITEDILIDSKDERPVN
jgi:hypothetical protein